MLPVRVNADYEQELFFGRSGPRSVNESLEFLAFFLSDRPVFSKKNYAPEYLAHVQSLTGRVPTVVSAPPFENWWGSLRDLPRERALNSKIESTLLHQKLGLDGETFIFDEKRSLDQGKLYLAKTPFSMSGQGFRQVTSEDAEELKRSGPWIIEPLLDRVYDFSHYVFGDGSTVAYETLVDEKFQYRGSLFSDGTLSSLSFHGEVPSAEWEKFEREKDLILRHFQVSGHEGYSLDSFVYQTKNGLKIRTLCELNFRKTMGWASFGLAGVFPGASLNALLLARNRGRPAFAIANHPKVMVLSPGDTRFEVFYVRVDSRQEARDVVRDLRASLPDCEFPIEL